ncbi:MAG TPA: M14 family metallopeptidase [Blastocatellia bacterium]|nr:M14 family metallopeptidase [Blastocatellia bacterium]
MSKRVPRSAVAAICTLAPLALLTASLNPTLKAFGPAGAVVRQLAEQDSRRRERQSALRAQLSSTRPREFNAALGELAALDEPGALGLWQTALASRDSSLRQSAWREYQAAHLKLMRNELVPQVARIAINSEDLLRLASSAGLDVTIWSSADTEAIAAVPPYLVERMRGAGVDLTVLYDSIADWQRARADGDRSAEAITPAYQSDVAGSQSQVRIAVIDLSKKAAPSAGYSDWFGDGENILIRSEGFLAYLDVFSSDGSAGSDAAHIDQQYTRRGYSLAGFYTPAEFAGVAPRFFPGKSFNIGATADRIGAQPSLAERKFHNYDETTAEFTALANSHSNIARIVTLGLSYEGRPIIALKISKDVSVDDSSKPDVLFTGCHHAREWIAVEPPVYFANQLIAQYDSSDIIKSLVDHLQIWIVPTVNPDGLTFSQGSPNDRLDAIRLWRKNRRPISTDCGSGVGVDLNRNYGYQWRLPDDTPCEERDDIGASDNPTLETYRGPAPESEPELKAIKTLLDDPRRHFRAQIDYHNYSQLVLYPWGYQAEPSADSGTLGMLAKQMAEEVFKVDRKTYRPEQAISLYVTTGSSLDYQYAVNRVPAPFVVEMRPLCCIFNVPEDDIPRINEENWAGAFALLKWAEGPPVLQSVKAYQVGTDGTLSKLVYSAQWSSSNPSAGVREMAIDTRAALLEPGRLLVRLQFSKPLAGGAPPTVTLGRGNRLDELRVEAEGGSEGWQTTNYANDTWIGEAAIVQDGNQANPWRLSVDASDTAGFKLDAAPATIASYGIGTDGWLNYEGAEGEGSQGGPDTLHILAPSLPRDLFAVVVGAPLGGERIEGGGQITAAWTVPSGSGLVPTSYDLLVSTDAGFSFRPIVEGVPGTADKLTITLPAVASTRARLGVLGRQTGFGSTMFGSSPGNFTIGANVGGEVNIDFASSQRVDQNWSDADGSSGPVRLAINITLTNRGSGTLANPFLRVAGISSGSVILSRDAKSNAGAGARQSLVAGDDNLISPGEAVQARVLVGLTGTKKIKVSVELWGVAVDGTAFGASPIRIWRGKPKSK